MKRNMLRILIISSLVTLSCLCKYNLVSAADVQSVREDKPIVIVSQSIKEDKPTVTADQPIKEDKPVVTASSEPTKESKIVLPAATIENNSSEKKITMSPKQDISIEKKWTIKFSQPIDEKSISNNIRVIDKNSSKEVPCTLKLGNFNKSIEVSATVPYSPDSEYSLIVDNTLTSKYNKHLISSATMDFKTESLITDIPNVQINIEQEAEISLPNKVTAKMSNGETKEVAVNWSDVPTISSIPTTYTCYGTVDKYKNKVLLTVTIKPFVPVSTITNDSRNQSNLQVNLFNYLMNGEHRESTLNRAIELHGGELSNNCVFFASESLRRAGLDNLSESVCNTVTLTSTLKSYGWQVSTDLSKMLPGDICFTRSYGYGPTHTYVFMKWVDPSNYNYAYICDNQGSEYGNIYHKRNVQVSTAEKDEISYFMYLP